MHARCVGCSCRQAKLRIGVAEQSVLVALAQGIHLHRNGLKDDGRLAERLEQAAQAVKTAYSECPSYDMVSRSLGPCISGAAWVAACTVLVQQVWSCSKPSCARKLDSMQRVHIV